MNFKQYKYLLEDTEQKEKKAIEKELEKEAKNTADKAAEDKTANGGIEFDEVQAVKDAEAWLKNKYGEELYVFKQIPNMEMDSGDAVKSYSIAVDDRVYTMNLRRFDSMEANKNGLLVDVVGYDILPAQVAIEEPEPEPEKKPEL